MIKLIVTDMDGSLLNAQKQLPPDFFKILDELLVRKIEFAVASGRTYLTLMHTFEAYSDKIHFLSENGTNIYKNGKLIYNSSMPKDAWRKIAAVCESRPGVAAIINGENGDYVHPRYKNNTTLFNIVKGGFAALREETNLQNITDSVHKIGICDISGPENGLYKDILELCKDTLDAVISGPNYMDVMSKGVNKGSALVRLQNELSISREDTMAFGDFFNDSDMLKNANYSFVMENAPKQMRQYGRFAAPSNNDFGVTKTIRKYIIDGEPIE